MLLLPYRATCPIRPGGCNGTSRKTVVISRFVHNILLNAANGVTLFQGRKDCH